MTTVPNEPASPDAIVERLRQSEERYRLLVRLGRLINSSLDLREVFRRAAGEVHGLLGCDRVHLILLQPAEDTWRGFAVEFTPQPRDVEIPCQRLNQSAAAWVLRHRRPRVTRRLGEGPGHPLAEDRHLAAAGFRAYVYLPLLCRDEVIGIWGAATRQSGALERWDFSLLEELSHVFATALDNAAAYTQVTQLQARLEQENVYLRDEIRTGQEFGGMIGASPPMQQVRRAIEQVAATDSTVLILGETGTGKELVARTIHEQSLRRERLLVKVNCAALPAGVINSELFGHEAGAFTGATKRRLGRFELAHRGSIFLDEIAEISPDTQVLLLRVLQERVIERVGDSKPIPVDVRVIAATNRDLGAAVATGEFRADLFYRLNVFPVSLPPLRQRREDIPPLVQHFLDRFNRRMKKHISRVDARTRELLQGYPWPGNVRELENIIERAMIVTSGDTLQLDPTWLSGPPANPAADRCGALAVVERRTILEALQRCGGRIYGPTGAAAALGLKPTTLYGKMRKLRIRKQPGSPQFE
jgi:formate hydrogenlyase transcriptional activator